MKEAGCVTVQMQFKHTLGLQDFMNRTENQEQRRARKRGRGKRGNEIVARERTGEGRDDNLRGKTKVETERRSRREGANGLRETHAELEHHIVNLKPQLLTSPWKLLSRGATCFLKS
ncbi:hypothetical protein EYF80_009409 [Liparis tanakae]|uniref:Uncharacterized protein n=1 Tax=Liparis tanakae TaxID=230148 RepID=A0A4Z2IR33_9TELE|nr:hypothetical protein EYF80_009409 [Liparis tanakae]